MQYVLVHMYFVQCALYKETHKIKLLEKKYCIYKICIQYVQYYKTVGILGKDKGP